MVNLTVRLTVLVQAALLLIALQNVATPANAFFGRGRPANALENAEIAARAVDLSNTAFEHANVVALKRDEPAPEEHGDKAEEDDEQGEDDDDDDEDDDEDYDALEIITVFVPEEDEKSQADTLHKRANPTPCPAPLTRRSTAIETAAAHHKRDENVETETKTVYVTRTIYETVYRRCTELARRDNPSTMRIEDVHHGHDTRRHKHSLQTQDDEHRRHEDDHRVHREDHRQHVDKHRDTHLHDDHRGRHERAAQRKPTIRRKKAKPVPKKHNPPRAQPKRKPARYTPPKKQPARYTPPKKQPARYTPPKKQPARYTPPPKKHAPYTPPKKAPVKTTPKPAPAKTTPKQTPAPTTKKTTSTPKPAPTTPVVVAPPPPPPSPKPSPSSSTSTSTSSSVTPVPTVKKVYNLVANYFGANFYNNMYFFTYDDPTHGLVDYVGRSEASSLGLVKTTNGGQVYMGYATTRIYPPSSSSTSTSTSTSTSSSSTSSSSPGNQRRQASTSSSSASSSSTSSSSAAATSSAAPIPYMKSVRVNTYDTFTTGVFILDASHMPVGCGVWPAWWTVPTNPPGGWPNGGEIDVVEGISFSSENTYSVHTASGCHVNATTNQQLGTYAMSNLTQATNCASLETNNQGCGVASSLRNDYGVGYNNQGGGIHAMLWDADTGIKSWFFNRNSAPADIAAGTPDPTGWGEPQGSWPATNCDPTKFFFNHVAVFTNTICGDWAGNDWLWNNPNAGQSQTCAQITGYPSCAAYVQSKDVDFSQAYWLINSVKVYQTTRTY